MKLTNRAAARGRGSNALCRRQPNAQDGVEHSVSQKPTELQGERFVVTPYSSMAERLYEEQEVLGSIPSTESKAQASSGWDAKAPLILSPQGN